MKPHKNKKEKKVEMIAWAGIITNSKDKVKIDNGWIPESNYQDGLLGIFKTRKEAKQRYEGVIKVKITQIK